jgi:hypothetical protein
MGASVHALIVELILMMGFLITAFLGFKFNLWFVVWGLAGHGLFDLVHARLLTNPGVPVWWPSFCLTYDITAAGFLGWILKRRKHENGQT